MNRSDAELVQAARAGDSAAFGEIYERYGDRIYSFCAARLRNRDDAADCTQDTFVRAATRLGQLRDPSRLRPWLFAIARNTMVDLARRRSRTTPTDELHDMASDAPGPDAVAGRTAAAELIWSTAAALQDRDQDLLRLQLQEGLAGDDLADVMGVSRSHLDVMQNRLRQRISKAAGSLLVARHGRDDCVELRGLLADWDGRFTLAVRSKVTRHVESCEVCDRRRGVLTAPANHLGAIPLLAAPIALRARTAAAVEQAVGAPVASGGGGGGTETGDGMSGWRWRDDGFPEARDLRPRLRRLAIASAVCAAVALIVGAAVLAAQSGGGSVVVEVEAAPSVAPATEPDPTATEAAAAAPDPSAAAEAPTDGPAVAPAVPPTPEPPTPVPPTPVPPTPAPPTPTPVPPTPTPMPPTPVPPAPPTILRSAVTPPTVMTDSGRCSITTARASVVVADDSAITGATATWTPPGGAPQQASMTPAGNDSYVATVGPFAEPGTVTVTMAVTNELGGSATAAESLGVVECGG